MTQDLRNALRLARAYAKLPPLVRRALDRAAEGDLIGARPGACRLIRSEFIPAARDACPDLAGSLGDLDHVLAQWLDDESK